MSTIQPQEFLTRVYRAGVAAADPERATRQAVAKLEDLAAAVWVIAVGKGAHAMASGAVLALNDRRVPIAGGLVVANELTGAGGHGLDSCVGDHPVPGAQSFAAAERLAAVAGRTSADADALVLVSGGATSLIAAPIPEITEQELRHAFEALLASGADITLMNAIRKRLLRFGAGRLALALETRRIHCLIASDVIGNDPASIASGPCVPDPGSAHEMRERARPAGVWDQLPQRIRAVLAAMADGSAPDSPPSDHERFRTTTARVILDRTDAERGAADEARQLGAVVHVLPEPLTGDAAYVGAEFGSILAKRDRKRTECIIWSGETTVSLTRSHGAGGRCQEFALACAGALASADAQGITVLAAGTDGRDGPTDAAGAIVDASTWQTIRDRGIDPAAALTEHRSYDSLQAAGALLMTGPTGTNVNDLVIAFHL
jgi:hydroxypyruvate reductase